MGAQKVEVSARVLAQSFGKLVLGHCSARILRGNRKDRDRLYTALLLLLLATASFTTASGIWASPFTSNDQNTPKLLLAQNTPPSSAHKKKHKNQAAGASSSASPDSGSQVASPSKPPSNADVMLWLELGLAAVGFFIVISLFRFDRTYKKKASTKDGFVAADYSIPYCHYKRTPEGFVISYRRRPLYISKLDTATERGAGLIGVFLALVRLPFFLIALLWAAWIARPTRIEVTKDAVIVNGTRYRRSDFGGFAKYETHSGSPRDKHDRATLGFFYGNTRHPISGAWKDDNALDEFLSALNQHLRATPLAGSEHQPSPDQLRGAAQATDF